MIRWMITCRSGAGWGEALTGFGWSARAPQGAANAAPPATQAIVRTALLESRFFAGLGPEWDVRSVIVLLAELVLGLVLRLVRTAGGSGRGGSCGRRPWDHHGLRGGVVSWLRLVWMVRISVLTMGLDVRFPGPAGSPAARR